MSYEQATLARARANLEHAKAALRCGLGTLAASWADSAESALTQIAADSRPWLAREAEAIRGEVSEIKASAKEVLSARK